MSTARMSTELFPLEQVTIDKLSEKTLFFYEAKLLDSAISDLDSISNAYYFIGQAFERKYGISAVFGTGIISPKRIQTPIIIVQKRKQPGQHIIPLSLTEELTLNPFEPDNFAYLRLLNKGFQEALIKVGFSFNGFSYFNKDDDLGQSLRCKNPYLAKVRKSFHIYSGFNSRIRVIDKKPFVQIQPHCVIEFEQDLYSLYTSNTFSFKEIPSLFPRVVVQFNRLAELQSFWVAKTASDPINDQIFRGQSFIEFSKLRYGTELTKKDAKLIIALPRGNRSKPWYFSSEKTFPSFAFEDLAMLDSDFFAGIQSEMKSFSANRKNLLEVYHQKIKDKIFFDNIPLSLGGMLSYEGSKTALEPESFSKYVPKGFFNFLDPFMRFRNVETLEPIDVSRFKGYLGAAGDLLKPNRKVRSYDVPSNINLKIIYDSKLEYHALSLIHNLCHGIKENGPTFHNIFDIGSVKFSFQAVDNFYDPSNYSDISPDKCDCALVFGPRTIENDPIETKRIYTFSETQILNKGVPVQFISDEPTQNKRYDKSLEAKSSNPDALFGIGLNVLGKVGASPLILSPLTTDYFPAQSVVLGYNIARIFENINKDVSQAESPRSLVSTTIPLAAPIVILSGNGSELIQQYAYEVEDEASLFSDSNGEQIISEIPDGVKNIIVHKDGPFYKKEIDDLNRLSKKEKRIIPTSITTGFVPRLFSTLCNYDLPEVGSVFILGRNDFLMTTSYRQPNYVPEHRGWPNPIQIHIHEEGLSNGLTSAEKTELLYQIWSFTRANTNSQIPLRKPLSIHYSNRIANFLRKAGDRSPPYFKNFKGKKNRIGYNPRIFI